MLIFLVVLLYSMYVQCIMLRFLLLFFACLVVLANTILQNADDLNIDTPIFDSNADLITSLNPSDNQDADCSSQLPDDPSIDDERSTQDASIFRRKRSWCRNRNGQNGSGSSKTTPESEQEPPDMTPPEEYDEEKICSDHNYQNLVSCGGDPVPWYGNPNPVVRFFTKEKFIYQLVQHCHPGKSPYCFLGSEL